MKVLQWINIAFGGIIDLMLHIGVFVKYMGNMIDNDLDLGLKNLKSNLKSS